MGADVTEGPPYQGTPHSGCIHMALMQPCTCESDKDFRATVIDDLKASIAALDDHDVAFPADAEEEPWPLPLALVPVTPKKSRARQRPCKRHKVVACQAPCCR